MSDLPPPISSGNNEAGIPNQPDLPPAIDDLPPPIEGEHSSTSQKVLTGVEGAERGLTAGLSDAAFKYMHQMGEDTGLREAGQKYLGLGPNWVAPDIKDVAARQEENPVLSKGTEAAGMIGGLMTGAGAPGLIERGAAAVTPQMSGILGKAGSAFIKNAITSGMLQGGDEISKGILGHGDPETPVASALAHMGASALFGGVFGAGTSMLGSAGSKSLQTLANSKMGEKARNYAIGMGVANNMREMGIPLEDAEKYISELNEANKPFGHDWFNSLKPAESQTPITEGIKYEDIKHGLNAGHRMAQGIAGSIGGAVGAKVGGYYGMSQGAQAGAKYLGPLVERIIGKPITKATKYVFPTVLKSLAEGNTEGLFDLVNYANKISKGANAVDGAVNGLFKVGSQQLLDYHTDQKQRDKLDKYMEEGGLNTQLQNQTQQPAQYAEGGMVDAQPQEHDPFATTFPEQNMLLSAAKARIFQYLNGKRPQPPQNAFPFDTHQPDKVQEKSYKRALDIASSPLSVFNHIKDGTLDQEHVQHMTSMYPELYKHLVGKIGERIANNRLDDEKPSYKTRLGLSLFLGQAMDSTMSPMCIQQAQASQIKPSAPQQGPQNKGKPKQLKDKSTNMYKTPEQEAEMDQADRN